MTSSNVQVQRHPACPDCDFDLRATLRADGRISRCPECGRRVSSSILDRVATERRRRLRIGVRWILLAFSPAIVILLLNLITLSVSAGLGFVLGPGVLTFSGASLLLLLGLSIYAASGLDSLADRIILPIPIFLTLVTLNGSLCLAIWLIIAMALGA